MTNSTRPGGYDERLVVPLEASRRGAHRARVNPLVAVLPLLAVIVVVAAVIGVAYTLFMRSAGPADDQQAAGPAPSPTASAPVQSSAPSQSPSSSAPASSSSSSSSSTPAATVDKTVATKVYNGSVAAVPGLGRKAADALRGRGWTGVQLVVAPAPLRTRTTTVYYGSDSLSASAQAVTKVLGVGTTKRSKSQAPQGLVVVVGDDYSG
jgi:cytoskeletal protein RodZ